MSSISSQSSSSQPIHNLKRKADELSESSSQSPDNKRFRFSQSQDAGGTLTPTFRRASSSQFFQFSQYSMRLSLSISQEIAPVVTLSPLDEKLRKNFEKALLEHGVDQAKLPDLSLKPMREPLKLHFNSDARQGKRPSMEDFHFHSAIDQGYLMGIFDGHGEKGEIAKMAGQQFQTDFPRLMHASPSTLKENFKTICKSVHDKVYQKLGGTTALTCFFDKETNRVITSTLGDSEAKIFRKIGNTIYCIPLSCVRNWTYPKEEKRAEEAFDNSERFKLWVANRDAKQRYFPGTGVGGVNVSRSIGDKGMVYKNRAAISQSPIVTLCQLLPGDLLLMACDGLWDFVKDQQLIDELLLPNWDNANLAQSIVRYALRTSTDNVSVLCARAKYSSANSSDNESSLAATQPL